MARAGPYGGRMDEESVLAEAFARVLHEQWKRHRQLSTHGFDEAVLRAIGEDAAGLAVSNLSWHLALGECVTAQSLAAQWHRAAEEIVGEVESGHLVGLVGRHEVFLPLWQFAQPAPGNRLSETVARILEVFRTGLDDLFSPDTVVLWAATPQPELEDQEPRKVLSKVSPEELEWSARVTVARLAQ
ncbi:hypothetical protein GCM10010193_62650 [Kitasatospora atroaurantiaca]